MRFLFRKGNRLCSEKEIGRLFSEGKSNYLSPLRIIYLIEKAEKPDYKLLISVSKKNIKKASNRNLIKRRIREIVRHQLPSIKCKIEPKSIRIFIALIYTSQELLTYNEIEISVSRQLAFLVNKLEKYNG